MKKNKFFGYLIGIILIIFIWSIIALKVDIFPSIFQIIYNIGTKLVDILIISAIFHTLFHAIIAFIISLFIGIITSNLAYRFKIIKYILQPFISLLRSIPTISIILIVIMLVDLELITYLIVFMITYPIIYQNIYHSLENIDAELLMINKLDNTSTVKNYFYFTLPMISSGIINAIIQTFGLSIKIQIMSELLIGSTKIKGLGILLNYYKNNLELDSLFAITFFIILIVYVIETLLKKILKQINMK